MPDEFEKEWRYMSKIKPELLNQLCRRINEDAIRILQQDGPTEHEKYLQLYRHLTESDEIISDCFDHWTRSRLWLRLPLLKANKLLTAEHISNLHELSQKILHTMNESETEE